MQSYLLWELYSKKLDKRALADLGLANPTHTNYAPIWPVTQPTRPIHSSPLLLRIINISCRGGRYLEITKGTWNLEIKIRHDTLQKKWKINQRFLSTKLMHESATRNTHTSQKQKTLYNTQAGKTKLSYAHTMWDQNNQCVLLGTYKCKGKLLSTNLSDNGSTWVKIPCKWIKHDSLSTINRKTRTEEKGSYYWNYQLLE